jgi:hypothetical protein
MSTAFVVVFALFVLAMVGLAVTSVRWGVRRDRAARQEATARQEQVARPPGAGTEPAGAPGAGEADSRLGDR